MPFPATRSIGRLAPAAGAVGLLVAGMWVANQGGFLPESADKFFGTIYQGVRSLSRLLPVWLGIVGLGLPLRAWLAPRVKHRIVMQLSLGLGAMLMLDWLLAACGWLNPWTAWGVCGLGTAVITYHFADPATRERWHPDHWPGPPWTVLLGLPALGLLLVACTMPPGTMWAVEAFGYDVTSYHLEVPREWIELGQMRSLKHNVYSHLPMLVEAGYMKIAIMHGSVFDAVYSVQFFHASAAVLAAAAVARLVAGFAGPLFGAVAGAAMLATPWLVITGSLAYNEMFVQVFAAAALMTLLDDECQTPRGAVLIGVLAGLATMAKLTAAGFVALPMAVAMIVWLFMRRPAQSREEQASMPAATGKMIFTRVACLAVGAAVIVAPYLVRNVIWTGNPVFPFAADMLGSAHWSPEQVERWNKAHLTGGLADGLAKLPRQWLLNTGYGALGGQERDERQATDIARFEREYGLPLLWIMAAVGAVLLVRSPRDRPMAAVLCTVLAAQLLFWLLATHHQSRFLIPTLVPGCALAGLGLGRIADLSRGRRDWLAPAISVTLAGCLTLVSFGVFFGQTRPVVDARTQEVFAGPPWFWVDSLFNPLDVTSNQPGRFGAHEINQLPPTSSVLLVGDANQVLYILRPFRYATAFDRGVLAELLDLHRGNAVLVTLALKQMQISHVWINFSELNRLRASYGIDAEITPASIEALAKLWKRITEVGGRPVPADVGLFELPSVRVIAPHAPSSRMRFNDGAADPEKQDAEPAPVEEKK